ncbi:MAG TPA: prolyl oligopeptidase family serine peptidase [Anaerolineae bacterium]|nr:prolyl oligopeptidase family serine peptidase [Anaerolineae bacterium]
MDGVTLSKLKYGARLSLVALIVLLSLLFPPLALAQDPVDPDPPPPDVEIQAVQGVVTLTNTEDSRTHKVYYQVADSYNASNSMPLLVAIHGYSGTGQGQLNLFGVEANSRGWMLVAPDMHNHYAGHPDGQYALAWSGAQQDIVQAIEYMLTNYPKIDRNRIYIAGGSMGGLTTLVMASKYPDIFAAAAAWKPITNVADWYNHIVYVYRRQSDGLPETELAKQIRREIDPSCSPSGSILSNGSINQQYVTGCGTPNAEPLEYQRRSPVSMPYPSRNLPIHLWHATGDNLVTYAHSVNLLNSFNPYRSTPIVLDTINTTAAQCNDNGKNHCYNPPPLLDNFGLPATNIFTFLSAYTRDPNPPTTLSIRTDESKPYFWLDIQQSGGAHWTEVSASFSCGANQVSVTVNDTNPLTLGVNLGTVPKAGSAGLAQAGLGMSAIKYSVKKDNGAATQVNYTPGDYLTVSNIDQSVTITAINAPGTCPLIFMPLVIK